MTDGTSNTFLAGEKYLSSASYTTGDDYGDTYSMFEGHHCNVVRWCDSRFSQSWQDCQPRQDGAPYGNGWNYFNFGSAHANSFHMAFCDGSVHAVSYTVDATAYSRLANRKDGYVIDTKQW